jgi:ATP-binding cassette subfamily F protein 3
VHSDLYPDDSVLDAILAVKNLPLGEARSYLARFLFTGDEVFKRIGDLSGGERSRIALARLVIERANFLLLDEPTNHLDIASQEVLEGVLDEFPGTILLVTHDRYLVDKLADQLWILRPDEERLEVFEGMWAEYQEHRAAEEDSGQARASKAKWSPAEREMRRREQRARREEEARGARAAELEAEIHDLEHQMEALQAEIEAASASQQAMRIHELGTLYRELDTRLQLRLEQWAEVAA